MSLSEKKENLLLSLNYDMDINKRVANLDKKKAALLNETNSLYTPVTNDFVLSVKSQVDKFLKIIEDRYLELNDVYATKSNRIISTNIAKKK